MFHKLLELFNIISQLLISGQSFSLYFTICRKERNILEMELDPISENIQQDKKFKQIYWILQINHVQTYDYESENGDKWLEIKLQF